MSVWLSYGKVKVRVEMEFSGFSLVVKIFVVCTMYTILIWKRTSAAINELEIIYKRRVCDCWLSSICTRSKQVVRASERERKWKKRKQRQFNLFSVLIRYQQLVFNAKWTLHFTIYSGTSIIRHCFYSETVFSLYLTSKNNEKDRICSTIENDWISFEQKFKFQILNCVVSCSSFLYAVDFPADTYIFVGVIWK